MRVRTVLEHDRFDASNPIGSVQSDPGLLYYLTERVAEADGLVPDDWGADPTIEYPEQVDVPARFTVGLEWVVRFGRWLVGADMPLHVLCLWVTSLLASMTVIGVYLAGRELCSSGGWGLLAAALWALLPASYRTIGFVLVREDLALPFFALHLGLGLLAARTGKNSHGALAGLALGLAAATWHGAGQLAVFEAVALFALFLRTGANPLAHGAGRAGFLAYLAVTLLVPALRAKAAFLAPPAAIGLGLLLAARHTHTTARSRRVAAVAGVGLSLLVGGLMARAMGTADDLSHVAALAWAKISHVGLRPMDPTHLSFDVRMMWQGPFETTSLDAAMQGFGFALVALTVVLFLGQMDWARGKGGPVQLAASGLLMVSCLGAWMILRLGVLVALVAPVLISRGLQRSGSGRSIAGPAMGAGALLFLQLVAFSSWVTDHPLSWHGALRTANLREEVAAVEAHVPPGEAVASDFMTSTAILAHTGRPICVQPKWESAQARERVAEFWGAFYQGTPEDLHMLLTEQWGARYLLVDRFVMGELHASRYLAGLGRDVALPDGSAAALLLEPGKLPPSGFQVLEEGEWFVLYRLATP